MDLAFPAMASLAAITALFTLVWWVSVRRADAGIVDLFWAGGFVLLGAVEAVLVPPGRAGWLVLGLTVLWASRLSAHLIARHRRANAEDARYAAMRREGGPDWPRQSLTKVFLVQAVALWCVASPLHAALLPGAVPSAVNGFTVLGVAMFLMGFVLEAVADRQLTRFKADPAHRGQILQSGLFALCRHPNYLGEIGVWWGLGIVAFSLTDRIWAFGGPALLTFFIVKVSGVPPLDAVLAQRPGYAAWAAQTPALWPRWRRAGASASIRKGA